MWRGGEGRFFLKKEREKMGREEGGEGKREGKKEEREGGGERCVCVCVPGS